MELVIQKNFRENIWRFSMKFFPGIAVDVVDHKCDVILGKIFK